jgi:hypothetical protein
MEHGGAKLFDVVVFALGWREAGQVGFVADAIWH